MNDTPSSPPAADEEPVEKVHTAVVGAGAAGLAVTRCLRKRGIPVVAFDEHADIAHTWRNRHESLRLNSVRWLSGLPGRHIPRRYGRWLSRDDMAEYITSYAEPVRHLLRGGVRVSRIERGGPRRWLLTTSDGQVAAHHVVLATGLYNEPSIPDWPGRAAFSGKLLHAAEYLRPGQFEGERVIVVGAGVSGVDIASDLLGRSRGTLAIAVRTSPSFLPRELWHIPLQGMSVATQHAPIRLQDMNGRVIQRLSAGDLGKTPLGRPAEGMFSRLRRTGVNPSVDDGAFLAAVRAGRIEVIPAVAGLYEGGVVSGDGRRWRADSVIAATGYRTGLGPVIAEPGILDEHGVPPQYGEQNRRLAEMGLHVVGFISPLTGHLREIGLLARQVAKTIYRQRIRDEAV